MQAFPSNLRFVSLIGDEEINYYLDKYKPYDKAGGYGIQEWIGYIGVEAINGSFYNVMGLPVQKLYQELKHFFKSQFKVKVFILHIIFYLI